MFSVILLMLILNNCSKNSSSEFWKNFHTDLIDKKSIFGGLFSGRSEIDWINLNGKLKKNDFFNYANENDWVLVDRIEINNRRIPKEELNKLDKVAIKIIVNKIITNLPTNNAKLYIFSTEQTKIQSGNETKIKKNGFLIVENGTQNFKIVHIWGE